jgi:hypothetical protein
VPVRQDRLSAAGPWLDALGLPAQAAPSPAEMDAEAHLQELEDASAARTPHGHLTAAAV